MTVVRVINRSNNPLPAYQTGASVGMDIRAFLQKPVTVQAGERVLIPTGLYIELPEGYEAQVRPRSGLAYRHGITILNSPGTIDPDYRGEIRIILINLGQTPFIIQSGERIAQLVFAQYEQVKWKEVNILSDTERGSGGFGHTGK